MVALAQLADVILSTRRQLFVLSGRCNAVVVFHDPIGQALCARTMRIVKRLNEMAPAKLHFFLSKADTVRAVVPQPPISASIGLLHHFIPFLSLSISLSRNHCNTDLPRAAGAQ